MSARLSRRSPLVPAAVLLLMSTAPLSPASAPRRPPNIVEITRHGLQRGTSATATIVGVNLAEASAVLFDDPRITARIVGHTVLGPDRPRRAATDTSPPITDQATRGELVVEIAAAPDAPVGDHLLRVRTPLGTTPARPFEIGALPEAVEAEPNDESPLLLTLPATANGEMGWPGDVDRYAMDAAAGQTLVFSIEAAGLGSRLDSLLTLRDASGAVVARNDDETEVTRDALIVFAVKASGRYVLTVEDVAGGGGLNNPYRLTAGELPYVSTLFPLGGHRGRPTGFSVEGVNLAGSGARNAGADAPTVALELPEKARRAAGPLPAAPADVVPLALDVNGAAPVNDLVAARGTHPEVLEDDAAAAGAAGLLVSTPVIVNGRIDARPDGSSTDTFRFAARKGESLILSVAAARLGSPLDPVLEIADAQGRPVPRAIVRPVWQTAVDLRDRGSQDPGLRFLSWSELRRGDYVYVDRELMRVRELPKGPDEDVQLMAFRGRRFSYEGTSGESHALGRPIYKVELHPPGSTFSPNGLPLFTLYYGNDDGGPFYGKDSYLEFTAPATGEYLVRLRDSRGAHGPRYAYRLTIAPPEPDFTMSVAPANPNVPRGSRVPVTVFAFRHDGFDGPIEVQLTGLPAGVTASTGTILPGHHQVAVTLHAAPDAAPASSPFGVRGRARAGARTIERAADVSRALAVVSVTETPPLRIASVSPAVIELRPGDSTEVEAVVERLDGFAGRVPLAVVR